MPKITQIQHDNKTKRVIIYVDSRYCASIKPDIWKEMNLREGSEISCAKLHQKEIMVWRKLKNKNAIYSSDEKAINRTIQWFARFMPNLEAKVIDFNSNHDSGALTDTLSNTLFLNYPNKRNDRNISLFIKGTDKEVITLEVVSSIIRLGSSYWIRSDKLRYAQIQTKRDGWVVLYYKHPEEGFVWIKPVSGKKYNIEEIIKKSGNRFVTFSDKSSEVYSSKKFCEYINSKIGDISNINSAGDSSKNSNAVSRDNSNKSSNKKSNRPRRSNKGSRKVDT